MIILLSGSSAIAGDYDIKVLSPGDCVTESGNFVKDPYIEGCRELQIYKDNTESTINEAPMSEGKGFINGTIVGVLGGIIISLLWL